MRRFGFHRATSLDEALERKSASGRRGRFLAGGTDLLLALRAESTSLPPLDLIDLTAIGELEGISIEKAAAGENGPVVRLGALATHAGIARSPEIRKWAPLLAEAAAEIGSPQIRNRGTVGGNIINAAPCADTIPPLIALGAELMLRSVGGSRHVPLDEAITAPYGTVLEDEDLLTEIRFAALPETAGSAFVKLGRRRALSISRMSIAVILVSGAGGRLTDVRIAAGAVAPTVRRFPGVEKLLAGEIPTTDRFEAAGEALAAEMIRLTGRRWSTPYKEPVVAALLRRALDRAFGRRSR